MLSPRVSLTSAHAGAALWQSSNPCREGRAQSTQGHPLPAALVRRTQWVPTPLFH